MTFFTCLPPWRRFSVVLLVPLLLAGCCLAPKSGSVDVPIATETDVYRSDLADPRAKALFAYSQFRLFGNEGRWEEALVALKRAIGFDAETGYLQLVLARTYLHMEQVEDAAQVLEVLVEKYPDSSEAHDLLGTTYSFQKKYDLAIDQLRRSLELKPDQLPTLMRLAVTLERNGETDAAVSTLEKILEEQPQTLIARMALARIYQETGQADEAMRAYEQVLEQSPDHQQATLEYGYLLGQKDQQAAIDFYLKAVQQKPQSAAIRQRLGRIYLSRQLFDKALEQFRMIRIQHPDNVQIIARMAMIELELEQWSAAEADFRQLLSLVADNDRNRYYLAAALAGQNKLSEAISELEKISPDSSTYADAALQLAYYYNRVDRRSDAVEVLQSLLELGLDHPEVYFYLAAFLGDQEDFARARSVVLTGVEKYPKDTRLLYQFGIVQEKMKDSEAAVRTMEKVVRLDANHADALNFLAYYQPSRGSGLIRLSNEPGKRISLNRVDMSPTPWVGSCLSWGAMKTAASIWKELCWTFLKMPLSGSI